MKKKDFILIYIMVILIVFSKALSHNDKLDTEEILGDSVLVLEPSEVKKLSILNNMKDLIFTISNQGIINIEDMEVTALKTGHTTLIGTVPTDNEYEIKIDIFVIDTPILETEYSYISIGSTSKINFQNDVGASIDEFDWSISNPSIVSIDKSFNNINIIGLKPGTVTIKATYKLDPSIEARINITVEDKTSIIDQLINIAIGEEGTVEGANNNTSYGKWYGLNNTEWCAIFVSWVANQADIPESVIPKFASVSEGKAFYEDRGLFFYKNEYTPKRGDLIFFLNNSSHTGIVTKVENGRVYVIEGNSNDMVAIRNYSLENETITGYGTPKY